MALDYCGGSSSRCVRRGVFVAVGFGNARGPQVKDLRKSLLYGWSLACVLLVAYFVVQNSEPRQVEAEFSHIDKTGHASDVWAGYDLICFNGKPGWEQFDFTRAAERAGVDLKVSLQRCGDERSCCSIDSSSPGAVGLVRGRSIRCMAVLSMYMLEDRHEACIKPARLKVIRQTFSEKTLPTGRSWFPRIGDAYWKIEEN